MKIARAGVDMAKSVFHVRAVDRHDRPQRQAKLKRSQWLDALVLDGDPIGTMRKHYPRWGNTAGAIWRAHCEDLAAIPVQEADTRARAEYSTQPTTDLK